MGPYILAFLAVRRAVKQRSALKLIFLVSFLAVIETLHTFSIFNTIWQEKLYTMTDIFNFCVDLWFDSAPHSQKGQNIGTHILPLKIISSLNMMIDNKTYKC